MVEGHEDLVVSFVGDGEADGEQTQIVLYPFSHDIYFGTALFERGTNVIGGRKWPPHERKEHADNADAVRDGNNLVAKIYWPEESRASEVEILKKAKKYGEKIALIRTHIPDVVCHKDPVFAGCSTSTIRKFLGLSTKGSYRLRVIVSRRLIPIRELEEKEMLLAFLRCVRLLRFS